MRTVRHMRVETYTRKGRGRHVGGYDDLQEIDRTRGVRALLVEDDDEGASAGA